MTLVAKLRYQRDVVITLVDNTNEDYILWIDSYDRMIETENGVNHEVVGFEKFKAEQMFGL